MKLIVVITLLTVTSCYSQINLFELNKPGLDAFAKTLTEKKVIVLGEMHGTEEVPRFFLSLTKAVKKKHTPLTVALEIDSNLQHDIDDFMKGGSFQKLLQLDYFKTHDGRTSMAMGELMKELRNLKGVKVICFDIKAGTSDKLDRDSIMAINLFNHINEDKMIVLTGNLHANLKEGYWQPGFKSAIFRLSRMQSMADKVISLNTEFGGGTIWNCMQDGCKERDAWSNRSIQKQYGLSNFIGVYDHNDHPGGYSGFVYFEKVIASKPLVN